VVNRKTLFFDLSSQQPAYLGLLVCIRRAHYLSLTVSGKMTLQNCKQNNGRKH